MQSMSLHATLHLDFSTHPTTSFPYYPYHSTYAIHIFYPCWHKHVYKSPKTLPNAH